MSTLVAGGTIGAYQLVRELGAGGMGAVWLARHAMLGRQAAIKVLHDSFATKPDIVTRFFNEARAATAISDPGIVQIFDFGQHTDGTAYIVMEMLVGESLEQRLRRERCLAVGDAIRLMRQVASSLGAAHEHGIIHRDLKPDNIYIVNDLEVAGGERTKLLDFGIAKLTGEGSGIKTQTAAVMGTPVFMSPEQCRGAGHVDQRSDIYSLGCVLFQLLAGRPPFIAEGVGDLIIMHVTEPPPALATFVPGVPTEVAALVARCLAKDPQQRPASGRALAAELGALVELLPQLAPAARSRPIPAMAYVTGTGPTGAGTTGTGPTAPGPAAMGPVATGPTAAAGPTTLSSAAGAQVQPIAKRGRRRVAIAVAAVTLLAGSAIVVGVTRDSATTDSVGEVRPGTMTAPAPPVATSPPATVATPPPAPVVMVPEPTPAVATPPPAPPPTTPIVKPAATSTSTLKVKPKQHVASVAAATPAAPTPAAATPPAVPTTPPETPTTAPMRDDDFKKRLDEQRKRALRPTQVKPVD